MNNRDDFYPSVKLSSAVFGITDGEEDYIGRNIIDYFPDIFQSLKNMTWKFFGHKKRRDFRILAFPAVQQHLYVCVRFSGENFRKNIEGVSASAVDCRQLCRLSRRYIYQ